MVVNFSYLFIRMMTKLIDLDHTDQLSKTHSCGYHSVRAKSLLV